MSATQDKSQRHTFVYSNLYRIYKDKDPVATQATVEVIQRRQEKSPYQSLQDNLTKLNELHRSLQKMLKELEDLVKE